VVAYLKENLSEKNVLLVLQHICLYCSGSSENNFDNAASDATYWTVPVTEPPRGRKPKSAEKEKEVFEPSAPPADQVKK
jgi:hypothetical protein